MSSIRAHSEETPNDASETDKLMQGGLPALRGSVGSFPSTPPAVPAGGGITFDLPVSRDNNTPRTSLRSTPPSPRLKVTEDIDGVQVPLRHTKPSTLRTKEVASAPPSRPFPPPLSFRPSLEIDQNSIGRVRASAPSTPSTGDFLSSSLTETAFRSQSDAGASPLMANRRRRLSLSGTLAHSLGSRISKKFHGRGASPPGARLSMAEVRADELARIAEYEADVEAVWPGTDPRKKIRGFERKYEPDEEENVEDDFLSNVSTLPEDRPKRRIGTIKFNNGKTAWFYRIEKTMIDYSPTGTIPRKIVDFISRDLRYPYPKLLISVVGGALDFSLPKNIEGHLKRGLRKTIEATEAWIVTGGSDCGVMRYVGQVISEIDQTSKYATRRPVIGVAPFGVLGAKKSLEKGGRINNIEGLKWSSEQSKNQLLNSNHNVFIFYDDGTDRFGTELPLRGEFEGVMAKMELVGAHVPQSESVALGAPMPHESPKQRLSERRRTKKFLQRNGTASMTTSTSREKPKTIFSTTMKIFSVVLVVEGGIGTLIGIKNSLRQRIPIVVIEGSGRAADVISYAWRLLHDKKPESKHMTVDGLSRLIQRVIFNNSCNEEKLSTCTKMVLGLVQVESQITIFNADATDSLEQPGSSNGLDQIILRSLMRAHSLVLEESRTKELHSMPGLASYKYRLNQQFLYLSLIFNHVQEARLPLKILRSRELMDVSNKTQRDLQEALLWSLLNARFDFIKILCPLIHDLYAFLYDNDCKNLNKLFEVEENVNLKPHVVHMFNWNRRLISQRSGSTFKLGTRSSKVGPPSNALPLANKFIAQAMLPTPSKTSGISFIGSPCAFEIAGSGSPASIKLRNNHAYLDILLWSILMGHTESLAQWMWEQGGNSTGVALFASKLLRSLASMRSMANKEQFLNERHAILSQSDQFETLAVGVLEACSVDDHNLTRKLLELDLYFVRDLQGTALLSNAITLAVSAERTNFLAHPAALAVLEQRWYGDIDQETTLVSLFVNCCFPILLVQPYFFRVQFSDGDGRPYVNVPIWWKVYALYSSPLVKYFLDLLSHFVHLAIFSIVALGNLKSNISTIDVINLFWMAALTMDELRNIAIAMNVSGSGVRAGIIAYAEMWRIVTDVSVSLYWAGFALQLRGGVQDQLIMKFLFGTSVALIWIRTLRFYTMSSMIGPKVVMLARMSEDIFTYMALFFVFMMTYGVWSETLLRSSSNGYAEEPDFYTFGRITYRPFFQMFGELFLEDISQDTRCLGPEPFQSCDIQAILPVVTGAYCVLVNIVLVNLLIAMMARTYEIVQDQTHHIWILRQHKLLIWYQTKAMLATPFSLVIPLFDIAVAILRICGCYSISSRLCIGTSAAEGEPTDKFNWSEVDISTLWIVEMFQEKNTDGYFLAKKRAEKDGSPVLLALAHSDEVHRNALLRISHEIERLHVTMMQQGDAIEQLVAHQVDKSNRASLSRTDANWVFSAGYTVSPDRQAGVKMRYGEFDFKLLKVGSLEVFYAYEDPALRLIHTKANIVVLYRAEKEMWAKGGLQSDDLLTARFPNGEDVRRMDVPIDKRSWAMPFAEYEPKMYTSPYILYFSAESNAVPKDMQWADSHDVQKSHVAYGPANAIESRTSSPTFEFDPNGYPLNPNGRTGLRGRGALANWGPNLAHYYIIRKPLKGKPIERNREPLQEIFLVQRIDGKWTLPGGFVNSKMRTVPAAKNVSTSAASQYLLIRRLLGLPPTQSDKTHHIELEKILAEAHKNPLADCRTMDDRDTDNAWIDAVYFEIDLTKLGNDGIIQPAEVPDKGYRFDWVTMQRNISMAYCSHVFALQYVAHKYGMYW